jgi:hypothetical protein
MMRSVAWTGSSVMIAWCSYRQRGGSRGRSWQPRLLVAGGRRASYNPPLIAATSSSVVIAAVDASNYPYGNFYCRWQQTGARPWNPQTVAKGTFGPLCECIDRCDGQFRSHYLIGLWRFRRPQPFYRWQAIGATAWNMQTLPE